MIMYNLTNRAKEHFLNFFKSDDNKEEEFKDFLKAEYKIFLKLVFNPSGPGIERSLSYIEK